MASVRSLRELAQFSVMDCKLRRLQELDISDAKCEEGETVPKLVKTILTMAPLLFVKVSVALKHISTYNSGIVSLNDWREIFDFLFGVLSRINTTQRVNGSRELFYKEAERSIHLLIKAAQSNFVAGPQTRDRKLVDPLLLLEYAVSPNVWLEVQNVFFGLLYKTDVYLHSAYDRDVRFSVRTHGDTRILRIGGADLNYYSRDCMAQRLLSISNLDDEDRLAAGILVAMVMPSQYVKCAMPHFDAELSRAVSEAMETYWIPEMMPAIEHLLDLMRKSMLDGLFRADWSLRILKEIVYFEIPALNALYKLIVLLYFDLIEYQKTYAVLDPGDLRTLIDFIAFDDDNAPDAFRVHEILRDQSRAIILRDTVVETVNTRVLQDYEKLQDLIKKQTKGELKAVFQFI